MLDFWQSEEQLPTAIVLASPLGYYSHECGDLGYFEKSQRVSYAHLGETKAFRRYLKIGTIAFTNLSFMASQTSFILKVLIISAVISVLIKLVGPSLAIAATSVNTLIAVLTPMLLCAFALFWRAKNYQAPD